MFWTITSMDGSRDDIASLFDLSTRQIEVAIGYIEAHETEVMATYERILDRHAKGNPPELQAKLDEGHERFLAMVKSDDEKPRLGRPKMRGFWRTLMSREA